MILFSKFQWAHERIPSKFIGHLGTPPQKGSPALPQGPVQLMSTSPKYLSSAKSFSSISALTGCLHRREYSEIRSRECCNGSRELWMGSARGTDCVLNFFLSWRNSSQWARASLSKLHDHTLHSAGLLWTSDQSGHRHPCLTTHNTNKRQSQQSQVRLGQIGLCQICLIEFS